MASTELANANKLLKECRRRDRVEPKRGLHPEQQAVYGIINLLKRLNKQVERLEKQRELHQLFGPQTPKTVTAYPTLLSASHKAGQVPIMRTWLLLRAYDQAGRGWLELKPLLRHMSNEPKKWQSRLRDWRFCGRRRLNQILDDGEGVYWTRIETPTKSRLYLKSPAKLALALGLTVLRGVPVALPFKALTGSIKKVKAHFYASFESGRKRLAPISQAALAEVTGVPVRTQREYDKLLKRRKRHNIAIGGRWTLEKAQAAAWEHGHTVFKFIDWTGKRGGGPKAAYIASRIPDTRSVAHDKAARGRQRKINRELKLVKQEARANENAGCRTYHPNAEEAGAAFNRNAEQAHYWPDKPSFLPDVTRPSRFRGVGVWRVITS